MDSQVDSNNSLIDRARELGPVWCTVRWLTAIPLLIVAALVPDSGLGLVFWLGMGNFFSPLSQTDSETFRSGAYVGHSAAERNR